LIDKIKKEREFNPTMGAKKLAKVISSRELPINHKRIARILQENGLGAPKRKPRNRRIEELIRLPAPKDVEEANTLWSIDFMCTRQVNSFKFMLLNIIDVGTRISPGMIVERTFTSSDVTGELDKAIDQHGKPAGIITDNGTEFTSTHFKIWCKRRGITHHLTNKGCPAENCFVESFNSCVRRELLNANNFETINKLREKVGKWRKYYNEVRPHGSLSYQSPEVYYRLKKTPEVAV
jgi:putative transposase